MAARLAPDNVRRMHQSLHHLVADAPWNDEEMLAQVRREVRPTMQAHGPVVAWIVDDTGFPKQGKHSIGVARQYCGQVGQQDNCQVAVSLSVSTWNASLPIAWRLYLPEVWCQDTKRCQEAGVPKGVEFQTKPDIALQQIRQALQQQVPVGVVLADAGYGYNTHFRTSLTQLGLHYIGGMVRSPVCAELWQPIGFIRQQMLANSYSYLPVLKDQQWYLISDAAIAIYLGAEREGPERKRRLASTLDEAFSNVDPTQIEPKPDDTSLADALEALRRIPALLIYRGTDKDNLAGILTAFDLL